MNDTTTNLPDLQEFAGFLYKIAHEEENFRNGISDDRFEIHSEALKAYNKALGRIKKLESQILAVQELHVFILGDVIRCGKCGAAMGPDDLEMPQYICMDRARPRSKRVHCNADHVPAKLVEDNVVHLIRDLVISDKAKERMMGSPDADQIRLAFEGPSKRTFGQLMLGLDRKIIPAIVNAVVMTVHASYREQQGGELTMLLIDDPIFRKSF